MTIVPLGEQLEIEAFPYTRYGYLTGKVKYLSFEAVQDEKLGLVFPVTIVMEKSHLTIEKKEMSLIAGMAVTAEIKTGERRIIDYLLSPLRTTLDESFKER